MEKRMKNYSDGLFLLKLIKHRIEEGATFFEKLNLDTRDRFSQNALYWAISLERVEDVTLLLKHNVSREVAPNLDAFLYALEVNNPEIIELFGMKEMAISA
jgi:hypothetical protein